MFAKLSRVISTQQVQFDFFSRPHRKSSLEEFLTIGSRRIPLVLVRNPRARRYVLRLRPNGAARVTVPRGGSESEARRFAERNSAWLERQLLRSDGHSNGQEKWLPGKEFYFQGKPVKIETETNGENIVVRFGSEQIKISRSETDLRPAIEKHLWRMAAKEFPPKVFEHAAIHQLTVNQITVRNQRSRWGSCSRRGTISLNWRLIQTPEFVRDYIILHELMHLRQMNHSARYWREVKQVCPDYHLAEKWLKQHSALLW
ncbi:MAG TPA: SprT family zinc-dependent metalloprotease [Candidatus Angelobacter sp.]|nr:SprT family zinc-dependent metalloprotease [Candidatus Angelobacter sp.]